MAQAMGIITEIRLEPEGISCLLACPPNLRPAPGQYFMAAGPGVNEPLPTPIFPAGWRGDEMLVAAPLPAHWHAGMQLTLRGPLGNGFRLPSTARRVALASLEVSPARLMPLAAQALAQQAAVALYTDASPRDLPPEVEVLPLDMLPEAPAWADFLALDVSLTHLTGLRERLGLKLHAPLNCPAQVLVIIPMPCSGLASCGACSVATRDGWRLACSDGPVFNFRELELT